MNHLIKDIFQVLFWLGALIGGIITAFKAIVEMRLNRKQREEELRWNMAREAKSLWHEMWKNSFARNAMKMLDWTGREYEIKEGKFAQVFHEDVIKALRVIVLGFDDKKRSEGFDDKETFIRDCFDEFFDSIEDIEHYIIIHIIEFEDVKISLKYYIDIILNKPQFEKAVKDFMKAYNYNLALNFIARIQEADNSAS